MNSRNVGRYAQAVQPFGAALLIITAIGFALYGCYSIARAKYTNEF
ncbi:DUF1206 domain-containing protein [Corynebacterium striatum]